MKLTGFVVLTLLATGAYSVRLDTFNVDPSSITVSGLSSGGAMAMQYHVAFSSEVSGSGIFAGLPFGCGEGGLTSANLCMFSPGTINVGNLISKINNLAGSGSIDDPSNLSGKNVFVFHGTKDTTVNPIAGDKLIEIYENYGVSMGTELSIGAVHGFPTDFYGAACGSSSALTQYINNCDYHGAYEALNHLYGGSLVRPTGSETLTPLIEYDQGEFGGGALTSMDSKGFLYVPSGCADKTKKCKFHISLHGCQQYKQSIGDIYATKTGYLEVAEANDIIVIFPQANSNILLGNPNGCWDWWGYLPNYLTKSGAQMKAIHEMMVRAALCDGQPSCFEDDVSTTTATSEQTSVQPPSTTSEDPSGPCKDNEVIFKPFPESCEYYIMCACGVEVLLQCAPGLFFDTSINNCNFEQLVSCEDGVRPPAPVFGNIIHLHKK